MAESEKELHFIVVYRGKPLQLKALGGSTVGDLGKELVELTGVAARTLRLILPKRPPLQPLSDQDSVKLLYQSGIIEGMRMVMMGSSSEEVAAVSVPSVNDRIIGFTEEEQRFRQRSSHAGASYVLPKGNYVFCDFQTLRLPGIELNPPPAMALKIMYKLACDRGITAIMNKYRWRVGVMTEMAPIGYVGISPKCILGFNKNRGQEISLRLRTDDLKGFRKYESIKKTLLHELAHMVHDEHDEKFHALDRKLNEEAVALDWTKSQGHTISGLRFDDEEVGLEASSSGGSKGYKVGGIPAHFVDARAAAAAAALRRFGDAGNKFSLGQSSQNAVLVAKPRVHSEPDPDGEDSEFVASGDVGKENAAADGISGHGPVTSDEPDPDETTRERLERNEPDPDEASNEHGTSKGSNSDGMNTVRNELLRSQEPEDASSAPGKSEPDPDELMETFTDAPERKGEPDPDESLKHYEQDGDETSTAVSENSEPDPDAAADPPVGYFVKRDEPDPDESVDIVVETHGAFAQSSMNEPDPDESVDIVVETDGGAFAQSCMNEPDPDETADIVVETLAQSSTNEPDPDEAVDIMLYNPVRKQEPDPDEASGGHVCRNKLKPDDLEIQLTEKEVDHAKEVESMIESTAKTEEQKFDALSSTHVGKDELETVHVHNRSPGDRYVGECVDCRRMARKRVKSSTGGGLAEVGEPQMSR